MSAPVGRRAGNEDAIPQTFAQAIYYLDTPSSSIAVRLNSLRYLQSYIASPIDNPSSSPPFSSLSPNSMADRIKINQLILDNILLILNCEDMIPDLRKRQLIKTECFLLLSQVLKSKSLFSGVPNVTLDDHMTPPQVHFLHSQTQATPILRSQDDEMVKKRPSQSSGLSKGMGIDPLQSPQDKKDIRKKQKLKKENEAKTLLSQSTPLPPLSSNDSSSPSPSSSSPHSPTLSTSSSSPLLFSSSAASLPRTSASGASSAFTTPHEELFASQLKKTASTNLSLIKQKPFFKPRQSVLIGSHLHEEPLVPGVDPTNHLQMDKQLGYQKSRLWLPFNGPGTPLSCLSSPLLSLF
jgi:hypothetical protein